MVVNGVSPTYSLNTYVCVDISQFTHYNRIMVALDWENLHRPVVVISVRLAYCKRFYIERQLEMTKILFERSGGIVGQDIKLDLDLDTLPASEALNLIHLIQEADFFKLPEDLVATSTPDEFVYILTVESGSSQHCVRSSDTSSPEALRPLLNVLSTLAMVSLK